MPPSPISRGPSRTMNHTRALGVSQNPSECIFPTVAGYVAGDLSDQGRRVSILNMRGQFGRDSIMSERPEAVLLSARRTAIGRFLGSLSEVPAVEIGRQLARQVLNAAAVDPDDIDETILGCVIQAGQGQNVARQIAVRAGVPVEKPAFTVNQVCGSGLKAVELASNRIWLGESEVVLAGGVENMTLAPYVLLKGRQGYRLGDGTLVDTVQHDALTDAFDGLAMGCGTESLVEEFSITRAQQDEYALRSQERYEASREKLAEEIAPVSLDAKSDGSRFDRDEHPRRTSLEALGGLRPVFKDGGSITPGNSSGLNDGAAMAVVASRSWADERGLSYRWKLPAFANIGVEPRRMGIGPAGAIEALWTKTGLKDSDIDLYEINEAFAGQILPVIKSLGLSMDKVNVNGGAIAIGHPLGASGCRLLVTLVHEMRRRDARLGVAALCIGGGMGIAALVETV